MRSSSEQRTPGVRRGRAKASPARHGPGTRFVRNPACSTARRVTLRAFTTYSGGKRRRYGNWTCKILRQAIEYTNARCIRSGDHVVRWETGA